MVRKILVVEDSDDIRQALCIFLRYEGYEPVEAPNGYSALNKMIENPDLVILDVMLPDISGIDVCKQIRTFSNVPILFLTAKSGVDHISDGLMAGGDDYLAKPFVNEELSVRIKALLRRFNHYRGKQKSEDEMKMLVTDRLRVNLEHNEVYKDNKRIELSEIEYQMLKLFMKRRNMILSAQLLYESIWEQPYFYDSNNTVMVHIRKLRVKIEDNPKEPKYILTEWGRGYRFGK